MKHYGRTAWSLFFSVGLITFALLITPRQSQTASKQSNVLMLSNAFQQEVIASQQPVVVDFFAEWCPACKAAAPLFSELADTYKDKVKFVAINVDQFKDLSQQYNIQSIPTFVFFKNGTIVDTTVGMIDKDQFSKSTDQAFNL